MRAKASRGTRYKAPRGLSSPLGGLFDDTDALSRRAGRTTGKTRPQDGPRSETGPTGVTSRGRIGTCGGSTRTL